MMAAAAALMVGMWATPSMSQCHLGIEVGGSLANTSLDVGGGALGLDGLGAHSSRPDMGIHGGCDMRVSNSPFIVGAFASYTTQDVKFSVAGGGTSLFSGAVGNAYTVGGRLGYKPAGSQAMPYILAGWRHADANWSAIVPIPAGILPSSMQGWVYGGGIEMPISGTNLSLAGEVTMTKYQSQSIASGLADLQADQLQAMVRLNWNFGSPAAVALPLK